VNRPRVLIPVTYGLSVRYLHPTGVLEGLAAFCEPVVGLGWRDDDLERELRRDGCDVVALPAARLDHEYRMYRRRLDLVHRKRLASPTTEVLHALFRHREGPTVRAIGGARHLLDAARVGLPGGTAAVEAGERGAIERWTNVADFARVLSDRSISAVLSVTPYHDQDGLVLWAAQQAGRPTLTSVISFDNPTTRSRMIARSDRILVWNRYNADEILRAYPDVEAGRLGIIGAPQFDLHRRQDLLVDEGAWRTSLGLPAGRPIILYGAGPSSLVPAEFRLVTAIDRAIDDGRVPGEPYLLVRRHPADDPEPWRDRRDQLRHGTIVDPWAPGSDPNRSWPTRDDLVAQVSSLAHSAVHVNVCSSMTLDGAMFDRPQIGPAFIPGDPEASAVVASFYRQEHWQPLARAGGVADVRDEAALVAAIVDGLTAPERLRGPRRRLLEETLTYLDGRSSERLVAEVGELLAPPSPGSS
jgi:hypothetical protein